MRKPKMRKKMPFQKMWRKYLTREYGETQADDLMTRIQKKYHELCTAAYREKDLPKPVLWEHLTDNIFPQMAAYKIFLEDGESKESAFEKTEKLHFLTLDTLKKKYYLLTRFPWAFIYNRVLSVIAIKRRHPPEGWNLEWVENSRDCFSLKAHSCFYYDMIKEYGVPEMTLIYCNGDDYVFDMENRYIKWGRKVALTRGGDYCDIIFYRASKKNRNKKKAET